MSGREVKMFTLCGGNGLGVPPVPIPNTEVKPQHVDGTWLVTARKSRSLPHSISPHSHKANGDFAYIHFRFVSEPIQLNLRLVDIKENRKGKMEWKR